MLKLSIDIKKLESTLKNSKTFKMLKELDKKKVEIGFFSDVQLPVSQTGKKFAALMGYAEDSIGPNAAQLAAWMNYGTYNSHGYHTPARPFFDYATQEIKDNLSSIVSTVKITEKFYDSFGNYAVKIIHETINDSSKYEANAPITIELKGSDKPLIDEGNLISSVEARVVNG